MQKISISPIDICVTNYKSRKSHEKVDPCIIYEILKQKNWNFKVQIDN